MGKFFVLVSIQILTLKIDAPERLSCQQHRISYELVWILVSIQTQVRQQFHGVKDFCSVDGSCFEQ